MNLRKKYVTLLAVLCLIIVPASGQSDESTSEWGTSYQEPNHGFESELHFYQYQGSNSLNLDNLRHNRYESYPREDDAGYAQLFFLPLDDTVTIHPPERENLPQLELGLREIDGGEIVNYEFYTETGGEGEQLRDNKGVSSHLTAASEIAGAYNYIYSKVASRNGRNIWAGLCRQEGVEGSPAVAFVVAGDDENSDPDQMHLLALDYCQPVNGYPYSVKNKVIDMTQGSPVDFQIRGRTNLTIETESSTENYIVEPLENSQFKFGEQEFELKEKTSEKISEVPELYIYSADRSRFYELRRTAKNEREETNDESEENDESTEDENNQDNLPDLEIVDNSGRIQGYSAFVTVRKDGDGSVTGVLRYIQNGEVKMENDLPFDTEMNTWSSGGQETFNFESNEDIQVELVKDGEVLDSETIPMSDRLIDPGEVPISSVFYMRPSDKEKSVNLESHGEIVFKDSGRTTTGDNIYFIGATDIELRESRTLGNGVLHYCKTSTEVVEGIYGHKFAFSSESTSIEEACREESNEDFPEAPIGEIFTAEEDDIYSIGPETQEFFKVQSTSAADTSGSTHPRATLLANRETETASSGEEAFTAVGENPGSRTFGGTEYFFRVCERNGESAEIAITRDAGNNPCEEQNQDQGEGTSSEPSIELEREEVQQGQTINIETSLPEDKTGNMKLQVRNPSGEKIYQTTLDSGSQIHEIEVGQNKELGEYQTQLVSTDQNILDSGLNLIGDLIGDNPYPSFRVIERPKPEWVNYCEDKNFATSIEGKANCIEQEIIPNYFNETVGEQPEVAESVCEKLVSQAYNREYTYNQDNNICKQA